MHTLLHSYKNYKSSLKQRISVFTPKEMLEFYQKCQNNKLDIFTLTRFCFANIDFNNDISNLLLYGLLSRKINEMEENNKKFPLQLILLSDKHNNDVLSLFNKIYLSDYQEQNNDEIKSIQIQIDELDGINSTINSVLLEMIKKMANGTKKAGEILIFISEPNSNQEILNSIINKVSECSSDNCKVIPIDYRKHKLLNSKKIHAFNDRLSQFYNLKQKALFVLPINTEIDFQYNKKYKAVIQNPVKNHPNVIKVIITNKPSELSINRLSAVIDISLKYDSYYDENDIENKCLKQLPNKELIKRKSLFMSMHPKQYYQIISRNSSYDDEYQNIYETIFKYINLGFSIDELQDLPNKTEALEGALNNLIKYGLITSTKPYKLTSYGDFINSFEGINILISMAISTVSGYSSKDDIPKNKAFNFKTDNDAKLLIGLLIYHLIKKGNIFLKGLPEKYARYADKRSDLIPMICVLCDYFQLNSSKMQNVAPSFGVSFSKTFPIYKDMTNFINNVYKVVKNQKMNVFQKVQRLVNKMFNKDKLYDFIQQILTEIQNYEPEFINVRRARLINIQNDKNNMMFIFKGKDSNIKYQKCNRLIIPSNKTSNGFLLHLSKDCLGDQTYGSIYHIDESFILCGLYPYPWLEENKNKNISNDLVIRFANIIAPNCVNVKLLKHRLIFTSDKSVLTPSNNVPLIDDGDVNEVIYSYAKNYIKEDKLFKSLEHEFKGFFYRGKEFPKIKEIDQFSQNSSNNCQIWNLGKGCLCVDVKGTEYEQQLKKISDILQKKNIKFNVQIIPLYNVVISHDIKSKLSNDQFIEKINSIINKFGGIIINRLKYYEETILKNTRKGNASFLIYSSYFAIPLAKMIKNSINNEQEESNETLKIPNDIVDEVILKNPQVFLALNSWFKKNNFNIIHKQNKYIGTKTTVNNVLAKIKIDPPSIPFKSYDIPKAIFLEDIYESANRDKKNWYVNKKNKKLIVPSKVHEEEVERFFEENTILIIEEEETDIEVIDDDEEEEETDIEVIDDDEEEETDIEVIDDDEEEETDIEIIDDDEEEEENEILIIPNSIIIDQVLLNNKRVINILNNWFRTNKFNINGNPPKYYGSKSTINEILKKFKSKPPKIPFKSYDIPEFILLKELIESVNNNKNDWYVNKRLKKLIVPSKVLEEEVKKIFNENAIVINEEEEEEENDIEIIDDDEEEEKEIEEVDDYDDDGDDDNDGDDDDDDESEDSNFFDFDDEDEDEYEQRKPKNSHNSKIKEVEEYNFKNENEIDNLFEVDEDYENI